jgi:hypothetical protein
VTDDVIARDPIVSFSGRTMAGANYVVPEPGYLTFTLNNYNFANFDPQGWGAYLTSLKMAEARPASSSAAFAAFSVLNHTESDSLNSRMTVPSSITSIAGGPVA